MWGPHLYSLLGHCQVQAVVMSPSQWWLGLGASGSVKPRCLWRGPFTACLISQIQARCPGEGGCCPSVFEMFL